MRGWDASIQPSPRLKDFLSLRGAKRLGNLQYRKTLFAGLRFTPATVLAMNLVGQVLLLNLTSRIVANNVLNKGGLPASG